MPWVAEKVVKSQLDDRGEVVSVNVSAFPAFKLLFKHADDVDVHMKSIELGTGEDIGAEIQKSTDADTVDVKVDEGTLGPLKLHDLEFHKDGDQLTGQASVTSQDLQAALPFGLDAAPVASGDGALVMEVSFGPIAGRARLSAQDGKLRIAPDGLLGGFAALTIFDDPRVVVTGVGAKPEPDGFTLTAAGEVP